MFDSFCRDCGVVVNGTSSFLLENIASQDSGATLQVDGKEKLSDSLEGKTYTIGHVHTSTNGTMEDAKGEYLDPTERGTLTGSDGRYLSKSQPQYADFDASNIASVKDHGAKGSFSFLKRRRTMGGRANNLQVTVRPTTPMPSTKPSKQTPTARSPTSRTASTSSPTPSKFQPAAGS